MLRDAFLLYKNQWWRILIICAFILLPIQLVGFFLSNYFNNYFAFQGYPYLGPLYAAWISIVCLSVSQIPLIYIAAQDNQGKKAKISQIFYAMAEYIFPVYIMSLIYVLFVAIGTFLLLIPGMIALILFFAIPYVAVIEDEKWWQGLKGAFEVGKGHFFSLMAIIIIFGGIQWLIESLSLFGSLMLVDRFIYIALIQIGISILLLPIFTFYLSFKYMEWRGVDSIYNDYNF